MEKTECICKKLRNGSETFVDLGEYQTGPYISLSMIKTLTGYSIEANGEDMASTPINYCPFCGKKL